MNLREQLDQIAQTAERLSAQAGGRLNESDTKRLLVEPLLEALGWDVRSFDDLRMEYAVAGSRVDYALLLSGKPVLFVEAKPLGSNLDDERWISQTINYANSVGVEWCVLTNGVDYGIYRVHEQVPAPQKLFRRVTLEHADDRDEAAAILDFLTKPRVRDEAITKLWQTERIDRRVRDALQDLVDRPETLVRVLDRRITGLDKSAIRDALGRLTVTIAVPDLAATSTTAPAAVQKTTAQPGRPKRQRPSKRRAPETAGTPEIGQHGQADGPSWPDQATHCLRTRKHAAYAVFDPDSQTLTVLAGSTAIGKMVPSYKGRARREQLIADGILAPGAEGNLVFTSNHTFSSPSGAAGIVRGMASSGWDLWLDREGRTLQALRRKS